MTTTAEGRAMVASEFDTETVYDNAGGQYDITYDLDIEGLHVAGVVFNGKDVERGTADWYIAKDLLAEQIAAYNADLWGAY